MYDVASVHFRVFSRFVIQMQFLSTSQCYAAKDSRTPVGLNGPDQPYLGPPTSLPMGPGTPFQVSWGLQSLSELRRKGASLQLSLQLLDGPLGCMLGPCLQP